MIQIRENCKSTIDANDNFEEEKSCDGKQKVACLQEYCDKETGENFEGDYLRRTQHTWKASLNDIIESN